MIISEREFRAEPPRVRRSMRSAIATMRAAQRRADQVNGRMLAEYNAAKARRERDTLAAQCADRASAGALAAGENGRNAAMLAHKLAVSAVCAADGIIGALSAGIFAEDVSAGALER